MVKGTAKFDGIAVGEFTVNYLGPATKMTAKAAFVSSGSGHTHGWTHNEQWSPETIKKLDELRGLMEADLGRLHFGDSTALTTESARNFGGGLSEHLADLEGRSI